MLIGPPKVLIFQLLTPPVLEEFDFNRTLTGDEFQDSKKFRRRVGALHPAHESIAPYAHHLRILPYDERHSEDVLLVFKKLCAEAGLRLPQYCTLEAKSLGLFATKKLDRIRNWLQTLCWEVAFQIEKLLHNGLLNSEDVLKDLFDPINALCRELGAGASEILRHFNQALQFGLTSESPRQCLERVRKDKSLGSTPKLAPGMFHCHHVTFTPTRLLLEGPCIIQSNRVIRQYPGFEDKFIRVDFRDEDKLQFRWDREVDGTSFLEERVGGLLKEGFELAGRRFEFLAYSSSALRDHAVWFVCPFVLPGDGAKTKQTVTAEYIRESLGDFRKSRLTTPAVEVHDRSSKGTSYSWGLVPLGQAKVQPAVEELDPEPEDESPTIDEKSKSNLIFQPSKYAARLAQAFTATDDSVEISKGDWEEVEDLGPKGQEHTDGCGTISKDLGDKIWGALCENRRDHGTRAIQPSAVSFQAVSNCYPRLSWSISTRYGSWGIRALFPSMSG
jgi:RNA-dependent RNA polymerase